MGGAWRRQSLDRRRPGVYNGWDRSRSPSGRTAPVAVRGRTSAKIWYHTCGSCRTYVPDLLDNGIHILNPVQISAEDMEPEGLKRDFGESLAFWGGAIDAQKVLPVAGPDEVREHVRRSMEAFKPGGGYVFNNVHNIQAGVPAENVLAMYDAAYEFGWY